MLVFWTHKLFGILATSILPSVPSQCKVFILWSLDQPLLFDQDNGHGHVGLVRISAAFRFCSASEGSSIILHLHPQMWVISRRWPSHPYWIAFYFCYTGIASAEDYIQSPIGCLCTFRHTRCRPLWVQLRWLISSLCTLLHHLPQRFYLWVITKTVNWTHLDSTRIHHLSKERGFFLANREGQPVNEIVSPGHRPPWSRRTAH